MNDYNENPLYKAFIDKNYEYIKKILTSENAKELVHDFDSDKSALHHAAKNGYTDIIGKIIELGIDPDIIDHSERTPLHIAASSGNRQLVTLLLSRGANINYTDSENITPLYLAILNKHKDIAIILLREGADPNIYTEYDTGGTALHRAVDLEAQDIVIALLNKKANINALNHDNETALHIAADLGNRDIILALMNSGASINTINSHNDTPLHLAASSGHTEILNLLIQHGANVNITNNEGENALFKAMASDKFNLNIANILIQAGTDINSIDNFGNTLLHKAVQHGNVFILHILLKAGVNLEAKDQQNNSPLQLAVIKFHETLNAIAELAESNPLNNTTTAVAHLSWLLNAYNKYKNIILELINIGGNITILDINSNPHLHPEVKSLLEAGLFVDALYHNSIANLEQYSMNNKITEVIPRLEYFIKQHGIPPHLLRNNLPTFIRLQVTHVINNLTATADGIEEALAPHLAIILNTIYPDQFPSKLSYSQVMKHQYGNISIYQFLLNSYEQMSHFKPQNFFDYMLNLDNHTTIRELFDECQNEVKLMFNSLDKLILFPDQHIKLTKLKNMFNSPTIKTECLNHNYKNINEAIDNNSTHITVSLKQNGEKVAQSLINQPENISPFEANDTKFQDRIVAERKLILQSNDNKSIPHKPTSSKRISENSGEFVETERKLTKAKYQERGL